MPGKPEVEDRRFEGGGQIQFPSGICSRPWWRGVQENDSKPSSSTDQLSGPVRNSVANGGAENGVDFNKQTQPMLSPSLSAAGRIGFCVVASYLEAHGAPSLDSYLRYLN